MTPNSFDAKATLTVGDREYEIFRLDALQEKYDIARLPYSLKFCSRTSSGSRTAVR